MIIRDRVRAQGSDELPRMSIDVIPNSGLNCLALVSKTSHLGINTHSAICRTCLRLGPAYHEYSHTSARLRTRLQLIRIHLISYSAPRQLYESEAGTGLGKEKRGYSDIRSVDFLLG
ncbi:hypothetical protein CHU98_g10695 [Xylaria longipes]|nr:hypothetical protein CHU98_g10695 [Xylaria longipes]